MQIKSIIVLNILVGLVYADFCSDNFTLSELPGGFMNHAIATLFHTVGIALAGCPKPKVGNNDVQFKLYTRQHSQIPILLNPNNPHEIDTQKPIKILVPGWLCSLTNDRIPELKDAYLQRYDSNVIGIDWSDISIDLYTAAFCNAAEVAKITANFICKLKVNLSEIHVIGHSMGGQLAGLIGKAVQMVCNKKIGRITGLDPAGPFYQAVSASKRLDASDALLVDVIHTNMGLMGYYGSSGTVDFFVNCAITQPGCSGINGRNIFERLGLLIGCSHLRAADYMVDSIVSLGMNAYSCNLCQETCLELPFPNSSHIQMGEDCPHDPPDRRYNVFTHLKNQYVGIL